MLIVLFCIYGISPESSGILKSAEVRVSRDQWETLLYEEGHVGKSNLCLKVHGKTPDLAWVEVP